VTDRDLQVKELHQKVDVQRDRIRRLEVEHNKLVADIEKLLERVKKLEASANRGGFPDFDSMFGDLLKPKK